MDFSKGVFRNQQYSVSFDIFGHTHENQQFIYSDVAVLQIGFAALILVDGECSEIPTFENESRKEWIYNCSPVIAHFMLILAAHNIDLRDRFITKIIVKLENNKLKVTVFVALPIEQNDNPDFVGLLRIKFGPNGVATDRVERLLD